MDTADLRAALAMVDAARAGPLGASGARAGRPDCRHLRLVEVAPGEAGLCLTCAELLEERWP